MPSDKLPRYWTTDEVSTWACDDALNVHMFPVGTHAGYPSACGSVVQRADLSDEGEYGPLEEWGNGAKGQTLCITCLDAWWNGPDSVHWERPTHPVEHRFGDDWTYVQHANMLSHLVRTPGTYACGVTGTRVSAPLGFVVDDLRTRTGEQVQICHPCAVVWDAQCARDADMDESEGRGWGHAYGGAAMLHRFWSLDLASTVRLTYCAPHRVPVSTEGGQGALSEFVDLPGPVCPTCLMAGSEPPYQAVQRVPMPDPVQEESPEAEVPEPVNPPRDLWGKIDGSQVHWIPESDTGPMEHAPACAPDRKIIQIPLMTRLMHQQRGAVFCEWCVQHYMADEMAYRALVAEKAKGVREAAQKVTQERGTPMGSWTDA